jgi:SAM-dependent methyltransferase
VCSDAAPGAPGKKRPSCPGAGRTETTPPLGLVVLAERPREILRVDDVAAQQRLRESHHHLRVVGIGARKLAPVADLQGLGDRVHDHCDTDQADDRARATEAAASSPIPIRVLAGVADELPLEDESVDASGASLVLCSVPDQDRALAELRRVLRAGGELRFYEHVIPNCQPKRLLLQAADHSGLWPRIAGGCHPARDTQAALERAGLELQSSERLTFAAARFEPTIPSVLGTARRRS